MNSIGAERVIVKACIDLHESYQGNGGYKPFLDCPPGIQAQTRRDVEVVIASLQRQLTAQRSLSKG